MSAVRGATWASPRPSPFRDLLEQHRLASSDESCDEVRGRAGEGPQTVHQLWFSGINVQTLLLEHGLSASAG